MALATVRKRYRDKEKTKFMGFQADHTDQQRKRHAKLFKKEKDAKAWLATVVVEVKDGIHTPERDSITVSGAARLWLDRGRMQNLERSTLNQYENHVEHHINPLLGGMKLAHLSVPKVEKFKDEMLTKASRPMARKVLVSLKSILSDAMRRGLVAQNVALSVKVETKKREKRKLVVGRDIPSKAEINSIFTAAHGRWRPLLIVAALTGLRASELRGLSWASADFERCVIHVRQRADLWSNMGPPKSEAGDREVPMTPMVVNVLKEWKLACPKGELDLVFPNGAGRVESHANICNRGWYPIQIAARITYMDGTTAKPKYGLHALRHFYASWAIEQGFSPKRLQTLLGHSSIQMTFDTYGHLFPSLEDDHAKFAAAEAALLRYATKSG
jgi:integrase